MTRFLAALACLSLLAGPSLADGCRPVRAYAPYHEAPAYHAPRFETAVDVFFFLPVVVAPPVQTATGGLPPAAGVTAPAQVGVPAPDAAPVSFPRATGYADGREPDVLTLAVADLRAACVGCHGRGQAKGRVTLFDQADAFAPNASWAAIYSYIANDQCPKGGPPVSAVAKERVRRLAATQVKGP